jgi:signal transduction histidine kinase/CheY-like chemotaxis protein
MFETLFEVSVAVLVAATLALVIVERRRREAVHAAAATRAAAEAGVREQAETLLAAGRLCTSGVPRDQLLRELLALIRRHVIADGASITIKSGGWFERVAAEPAEMFPLGAARTRITDDGRIGTALLTGEVVVINPGSPTTPPAGIRAGVVMPLHGGEGLFGALAVGTVLPDVVYTPRDVAFLSALSTQIAGALWAAELAERVAARATELEAAVGARAEFTGLMSHELRTPLNAILGFSEVLARLAKDDERQRRYLGHIQQSGRTLLELINQVLDFARLDAGKLRVARLSLEPGVVVNDVLDELHQAIVDASVRVRVDLTGAACVAGDPLRVRQALRQLISNAVKFTPAGGWIDVQATATRHGEIVRFTITDSGPGIPPEARAQLFQPYHQIERRGGTGLGLVLARQLAELMGGRVDHDAAHTSGARFWLELPSALASSVDTRAGSGPLVLIVDDDPRSAELAGLAAAELGCRVLTAASGEDGLALARDAHPSAVLLDVDLPQMSGYQVLDRLRTSPETSQIPVLMVSVSSERARSLELGAMEHLTKPQTPQALRTALGRLLDMRV